MHDTYFMSISTSSCTHVVAYVRIWSMYLKPLCLHQGIELKALALEKKLAELKAENKPLGTVLKQTIQTLCADEVGFVSITLSLKTCSFS